MRVAELRGLRIAIWGFAREGRAVLSFLRERDPSLLITVLDDIGADTDAPVISGREAITAAIGDFDVVVKSPGISLYDPLVAQARANGTRFTSLLNLWFADAPTYRTICVTGTKGKSTTTALIAHILNGNGLKAMAAGNIGVPVTELPREGLDAAVIEVSSYQAADFTGCCDIAVLTSLYQEHLDWHGSLAAYQRDKLNLLRHARRALISEQALPVASKVLDLDRTEHATFGAWPACEIRNRYLARPHNLSNVASALAVAQSFGIAPTDALRVAETFRPLPHRQQEIGELDGVTYVDDSISTTPEATIAALDVYRDRPVTVIIGGRDRGIDYRALARRLQTELQIAVVLMDASGRRIGELLHGRSQTQTADTMQDAVGRAREMTPRGGIILLSPAAPSYGRYRSFIERGEDFARCAGILTTKTQRHEGG